MDYGSIHYVHMSAASITAARPLVIAPLDYSHFYHSLHLSPLSLCSSQAASATATARTFPGAVTVRAIYNA